ncbi:MAG: hypothetical protein MJ252_11525, partial [archaeon]|nr:hypothetical protein [archaeon]
MSHSYNYNTDTGNNYYTFDNFLSSMKDSNDNLSNEGIPENQNQRNYPPMTESNEFLNQKSPVLEDLYKEKLERSELESKYKELLTEYEAEVEYSKELENNLDLIKTKYEKDIQLIEMSNIEKSKIIEELEETVSKQNELNNTLMGNVESYGELIEKMKKTIEFLQSEKGIPKEEKTSEIKQQKEEEKKDDLNQKSAQIIMELKDQINEKNLIINQLQSDMKKNLSFLSEVKKMKEDLMGYGDKIKGLLDDIEKKDCIIEELNNNLKEEKNKNEEVQKLLLNTGTEQSNDPNIQKINYFQKLYENEKKKNEELLQKSKEKDQIIKNLTESKENMKKSYENISTLSDEVVKENKKLKEANALMLSKMESVQAIEKEITGIYEEMIRVKEENKILREKLGISGEEGEAEGEEGEE